MSAIEDGKSGLEPKPNEKTTLEEAVEEMTARAIEELKQGWCLSLQQSRR